MSEPTKFKHLLHAKSFIDRGLELHIITEDQVDQVMECEILLGFGDSLESRAPLCACEWIKSGIAGTMLEAISDLGNSWRVSPPPTTPLPIVKPCHRCGESHDEANPPPRCADMLDDEARKHRCPYDSCIPKFACKRIAELEAELLRTRSFIPLSFDYGRAFQAKRENAITIDDFMKIYGLVK